jgi:hypothetical protein
MQVLFFYNGLPGQLTRRDEYHLDTLDQGVLFKF